MATAKERRLERRAQERASNVLDVIDKVEKEGPNIGAETNTVKQADPPISIGIQPKAKKAKKRKSPLNVDGEIKPKKKRYFVPPPFHSIFSLRL